MADTDELKETMIILDSLSSIAGNITDSMLAKSKFENSIAKVEALENLKNKASNEKALYTSELGNLSKQLEESSARIDAGTKEWNNWMFTDGELKNIVEKYKTDDSIGIIEDETTTLNENLTYSWNNSQNLLGNMKAVKTALNNNRGIEKIYAILEDKELKAADHYSKIEDVKGIEGQKGIDDVLNYIESYNIANPDKPMDDIIAKMLQTPFEMDSTYGPVGFVGRDEYTGKKAFGSGSGTNYRKISDDEFKFKMEGKFNRFANLENNPNLFIERNADGSVNSETVSELNDKILNKYYKGSISKLKGGIDSYVNSPGNSKLLRDDLAIGTFEMLHDQDIKDPNLKEIVNLGYRTANPKQLNAAMHQLYNYLMPNSPADAITSSGFKSVKSESLDPNSMKVQLGTQGLTGNPENEFSKIVDFPGYEGMIGWVYDEDMFFDDSFKSGSEEGTKYDDILYGAVDMWREIGDQFGFQQNQGELTELNSIYKIQLMNEAALKAKARKRAEEYKAQMLKNKQIKNLEAEREVTGKLEPFPWRRLK